MYSHATDMQLSQLCEMVTLLLAKSDKHHGDIQTLREELKAVGEKVGNAVDIINQMQILMENQRRRSYNRFVFQAMLRSDAHLASLFHPMSDQPIPGFPESMSSL
ncbi:hypothetical protein J3F84DRAFT_171859 [Trichoderma pleuroticola]